MCRRTGGFAFLGSLLALAATLTAAPIAALADTTAATCDGILRIVTESKVMPAANGLQFCLTLIADPSDPAKISGLTLKGPGANERYTLAQLQKGVAIYPRVLSLASPSLDASKGGSGTLTYASTDGARTSTISLSRKGGAWQLESYQEAVNTLTMTIGASPQGAVIISSMKFSKR
jgi:hypothetical protein